jgi:hypothetical protein
LDNLIPIAKQGKERGLYFIKTQKYSREISSIIKKKDLGMSIIPTIPIIWETFNKVRGLAKENSSGITEKFTRVNGKEIKNKVAVFGKDLKVFLMWENGTTI